MTFSDSLELLNCPASGAFEQKILFRVRFPVFTWPPPHLVHKFNFVPRVCILPAPALVGGKETDPGNKVAYIFHRPHVKTEDSLKKPGRNLIKTDVDEANKLNT